MTDSKMPEPVAWRYRCAEKFTAWTDPTFNRRSPYARIGMEEQALYTHPAPVADAELEALRAENAALKMGAASDRDDILRLQDALRARTAQPVGVQWQHVKRGSVYREVGRGKVQTDTPLTDYAEVVIYQGVEDGMIWVRPVAEFEDGRFAALLPEGEGDG